MTLKGSQGFGRETGYQGAMHGLQNRSSRVYLSTTANSSAMRRLLTTSILATLGSLACGKDQSIPTILACADSTAKNLVHVIQHAADSVSQSIVASNKMLLRSGVDDPELVCQQFPDQVSGLAKTRTSPIETVRLLLQEDAGSSDTTQILEDLNELLQIAHAAGLDDHTKQLMTLYGTLWSRYQGEIAVEAKKFAPVMGAIAQLEDRIDRIKLFETIVSNRNNERQAIELRQLREETAIKEKERTAWQLKALVVALVFVVLLSIAAFYVMRRIRNAEQAKVNSDLHLAQAQADAEEARANALCIDHHFLKSILTCLEGKYEEGDFERGRQIIRRASRLLARVLDLSRQADATLQTELGLVMEYIELEQISGDITIEYVPPQLDGLDDTVLLIPNHSLVPLVQNAVQHGSLTQEGVLRVSVNIEPTVDGLVATVANHVMRPDTHKRVNPSEVVGKAGIGTEHVRRVLHGFERRHDRRCDLSYQYEPVQGLLIARMSLPMVYSGQRQAA